MGVAVLINFKLILCLSALPTGSISSGWAVPGGSVHEMVTLMGVPAPRARNLTEATVEPLGRKTSAMFRRLLLVLSISAAAVALMRPHPVSKSGPVGPRSVAVWQRSALKVEARNGSIFECCDFVFSCHSESRVTAPATAGLAKLVPFCSKV